MMKRKRSFKLFFSILLVFTLLLSNFPAFAAKKGNVPTNPQSLKEDLKTKAKDKIHEDLQKELKNNKTVEALVYLKDRIDPKGVATANAIGITPYQRKLSGRKALVNALKDKAETSQQNLIKYLEQEKEKGGVNTYESYYIVNMVYVKGSKKVIENIAYMDEVEKIYPNSKVELVEPDIVNTNVGVNGTEGLEWNIERVGANLVWDLGIDGSGVVVGTIDTGIDWTHEALKTKWRGYDPNNPNNPNPAGNWFDAVAGRSLPYDEASIPHGSHVMGTILGQDPQGINKIGVAPGAKWIAAKAFTPDGGTDVDIIESAQWMMAPNGDPALAPDVINNSWGGGSGKDEWFRDMVIAWRAAGIVPVFAAGNERGAAAPPASISSPANYPESFAVAATDKNNLRGSFSQRGPSPYGDIIKPEISAPGVGIRSSVPGGYEGGWSGTSMATPHIVGTVALLLSANNSLTVDDVEEMIESTATPLTDSDYATSPNYGYGYGLVNAFDAVSAVSTGRGIIKGKVLVDGEDIEEPEIIHEPVTECFIGSDIPIETRIKDDISIISAELLLKQNGDAYWTLIPMTRKSGDHKDGIYSATVPYDLVKEPGFTYKIRVVDYGNNITFSSEYNVLVKFGVVPDQYTMSFENYPLGWIFTGDWEWGEPAGNPTPHSGSKLVGTKVSGNYSSGSDSLLITPPIDLRSQSLGSATLRLYHWYDTEKNYDKGQVYITNDFGETWIPVGPLFTDKSAGWKEMVLNLGSYIGSENPVYVAFRFTSDSSVQSLGWYIDDVNLVSIDNEAPNAPTGLTAEAKLAGVMLNWNPSPEGDLGGYKVYRTEVSGGEYTLIGETNVPSYMDTNLEAGKTYYYVVTAVDFTGNESGHSEEAVVTVSNVSVIYFSNFENDNGGLTSGGNNNCWEWGVPTTGPNGAFTGTKVWATKLGDKYPSSSDCWLESPDIAIPADGNTTLAFTHWYDTESASYDKCQVQVSADNGTTWTNITPGTSFGGHVQTWANTELSLESYKGQTIKIRFVFISDSSLNYLGWYIDNVIVASTTATGAVENIIKQSDDNYTIEELAKYGMLRKDYVEPGKIEFKLDKKAKLGVENYETVSDEIIEAQARLSGIPVDAVVTILETGKSVRANLTNGTYEIRHPANNEGEMWTIHVEAYGYYQKEAKVHLDAEMTVTQNFQLDPIPTGNIVGSIVDRMTNEPIANAVIKVKEDAHVQPATSDEQGNFLISGVYEGTYTLKVSVDGYQSSETTINVIPNQDNPIEIRLKRFVGYDEEISYDEGTAENALVLNGAGNGLAIRITPTQYGKVVATNIYFWGNEWPSPGGDRIGIVIFDTNSNGDPSNMVGEPIYVTINRGSWNRIDLSDFGFATDRDYFIATIQDREGSLCPGTGIDEHSKEPQRSYLHASGEFVPIADEDIDGGLMIRAIMEYSVDEPQITNLGELSYTNKDSITVEGRINTDSQINLYVNGEKAVETQTQNKTFAVEVQLPGDENIITATAVMNGKETEPSNPAKVIKHKIAPELNLISPIDGENINKELVHVKGNATDQYFDKVTVNDKVVTVDADGNFDESVIVKSGENIITVVAYDLAGNETRVERKVYVNLENPVITEVKPEADLTVKAGDQVEVSFRSEVTGGKASFGILLPLNLSAADGARMEMPEVEPGYYKAIWTVPENLVISNAVVEIEFIDTFGNTIRENAPGKITIGSGTPEEPKTPELTDIMPNQNQSLKTGDTLTVSFRSDLGGRGYFTVQPLKGTNASIKVDMVEVEDGLYKAEWVIPEGIEVKKGTIIVSFTSKDGIEVTQTLPISITIQVRQGKKVK